MSDHCNHLVNTNLEWARNKPGTVQKPGFIIVTEDQPDGRHALIRDRRHLQDTTESGVFESTHEVELTPADYQLLKQVMER